MIEFIVGCIAGIAIAKKVQIISEWQLPAYVRIVKMTSDKYAIRKGYLNNYVFYELSDKHRWWARDYAHKYCLGSLEECKKALEHAHVTNGTPI